MTYDPKECARLLALREALKPVPIEGTPFAKGPPSEAIVEFLSNAYSMADQLAALQQIVAAKDEALNKIAAWGDGPEVGAWFDEPGSAKIARDALKLTQPGGGG